MIAKLARALPSNRYLEIRPDRGEGLTATLMEERPSGDQGDRVISRSVAMSDKSFEFLTSIMVGVDAPLLTSEELEAVAYVRDMVAANPLAGCQDAISKRHTQMIAAFKLAVTKIISGRSTLPCSCTHEAGDSPCLVHSEYPELAAKLEKEGRMQ